MATSNKAVSARVCVLVTLLGLLAISFILVYGTSIRSFSYLNIIMSNLTFMRGSTPKNTSKSEYLSTISSLMKVKGIDCLTLFNGTTSKIKSAKKIWNTATKPIPDAMYINLTQNCSEFQRQRGYIMSSLTKEEEDFPIAFSLIVYKEAEMVERLIRAIYRPQNVYCIHVDEKSSSSFYSAITGIAKCFTNVFTSTRRVKVYWGQLSVLEPELLCMEDLWRYPKWKYFINLTGQEFPLKTNFELVKILTAYDGAVDVSTTVKYAFRTRWRNTKPPFGLRAVKGSVHIVVNRDFVDYILHNETATEILNWTKHTHIPDETFFAILNANPKLGIRGTYKGEPEVTAGRPFIARFKNWGSLPCAWKRVRGVCILTTGDLPLLVNSKALFANKFYINTDRVVLGCLEERIFNDTRSEYMGTLTFNTSFYSNLAFVKNRVM